MAFPNRPISEELRKLLDSSHGRFKSSPISQSQITIPESHVESEHKEIWPIIAGQENSVVSTNGWTPVSSDIVYDQIKRGYEQIADFIALNKQTLNTEINKVITHTQKITEESITDSSDESFDKFVPKCDYTDPTNCKNDKVKKYPTWNTESDFVPNVFAILIKNDTIATARRSKKVTDFGSNSYAKNLLLDEAKLFPKIYEVTEDSDSEGPFELEKSATKDIGYEYEPPPKQNKTFGLYEVLSKYKINKEDELPNYALSRRQKSQIPFKYNTPVKPFQNPAVNKYNNLNHLPVDPLLAVFLSNYGYYLRGMYGIHNHYNNLYGYLASNNIHNNRPFGVYKVFSDTDSSH